MRACSLCVILFVCPAAVAGADSLTVNSDFEGGSARVLEIDHNRGFVRIMPGGDPERGWPAWWCCQIQGLRPGQQLTLSVVPASGSLPSGRPGAGKPLAAKWAMPDRAAWSIDGKLWQQTPCGQRGDAEITYELKVSTGEVWIAWGPLATPATVLPWLTSAAAEHDFVETFELASTREGRSVHGIQIAAGEKPLDRRPVIWMQARQHAWESGSSWVARGVRDWLLSDAADAVWLRSHALVFLVPIVDVDRVATGDGGKEAVPHDHNRDWTDAPHYPEIAAIQERIRGWSDERRMAVFIDLHNPGPNSKEAFFFGAPDEVFDEVRKAQRSGFVDTIRTTWDAAIPLENVVRSTGPNYHPLWKQISSTWVTLHANNDTIAVCLETPWNTPYSTTTGYREVGASLAKGVARFFQSTVRPMP